MGNSDPDDRIRVLEMAQTFNTECFQCRVSSKFISVKTFAFFSHWIKKEYSKIRNIREVNMTSV